VDAHRSIAFVAGAYVKRGAVVSRKYTTVSFISTIVDILGIEHLGLTDYSALPMADAFKSKPSDWAFKVALPDILKNAAGGDYITMQQSFDPSYQAKNSGGGNWLSARYSKPLHDGAWWVEQTKGMDFSREDNLDANRYNHLLWRGVMGEAVPYPENRSRANLRHHRKKLLQDYYRGLPEAQARTSDLHSSSGGR